MTAGGTGGRYGGTRTAATHQHNNSSTATKITTTKAHHSNSETGGRHRVAARGQQQHSNKNESKHGHNFVAPNLFLFLLSIIAKSVRGVPFRGAHGLRDN